MAASLSQQRKVTKDLEWDYDSAPTDDMGDSDSVSELPEYDRKELRRRLSLDSDHDEDEIGSQISARIRRSILRERLNQRQNLQICFMQDDGTSGDMDSDDVDDGEEDAPGVRIPTSGYSKVGEQENENTHPVSNKMTKDEENVKVTHPSNILSQLISSFSSKNNESECIRKNFASFDEYHKQIHAEAKKALKSAKEMAKMQMQLEREQSKASRVLGIPPDPVSSHPHPVPSSHSDLTSMTRMQLRLLITKIVNRTEQLNVSLLRMLEERDELHMEQDSLLVDIQDMTQFLHSNN